MNNGLSFSVRLLLRINRLFAPTGHPFNIEGKSYAEWQFDKGEETLGCFSGYAEKKRLISGKTVLDVGCGAAGKSVFCAVSGASKVIGCDRFDYSKEAEKTAELHGVSDKFKFVRADAASLPFSDGGFDVVIMSDFIEHAKDVKAAVSEALRVCKPGGTVLINFTSYRHPRGAHLSDAVNVPWCQFFFSEKTLVAAYRYLISDKSDREYRENLKLDESKTKISYINRITIGKFDKLLKRMHIKPAYRARIPLRRRLSAATHLPFFGECITHSAVYVLEK